MWVKGADMKQMKTWAKRLAALLLILGMAAALPGAMTTPVSAAVTQEQINALKQDANKLNAQKSELKQQLNAVAADKSKALEKKSLLEQQINVIQSEINNITSQITQYDQLIAAKEEELTQIQEDEARQYDLFCQRVRMMEEEGEVSYWSILFNSSSFSDLLDRYMMVEEIMDYDNAIMEQLIATREQIKEEKASLETARSEQQAAREKQESAKAELKSQEAEVDKLVSEISAQQDQLEKAHQQLAAAATAMDNQIKQKEKELSEKLAASGTTIVSESGFKWPSYATTITSLYGSRVHPVTGKANNHTGVDIAAAGGTNILAAKSGVVITSAYNNSYGNYVVVSHGNGQTTLYAHMRKRLVSEGESVKQGQTLGLVGTTGSSTGNHLHFEIRVNGSRVDPLNYFKGSVFTLRANGKSVSYTVK